MDEFELRALAAEHSDYMWETIAYGASWRGPLADVEKMRANPVFQPLVEEWGREGDIGHRPSSPSSASGQAQENLGAISTPALRGCGITKSVESSPAPCP